MTRGGKGSEINGLCDDVVYVRSLVAPKITRLLIQKSSLSSIFNKAEKFPIKANNTRPIVRACMKRNTFKKRLPASNVQCSGCIDEQQLFSHPLLMVNFALCRICFCLKRGHSCLLMDPKTSCLLMDPENHPGSIKRHKVLGPPKEMRF